MIWHLTQIFLLVVFGFSSAQALAITTVGNVSGLSNEQLNVFVAVTPCISVKASSCIASSRIIVETPP